ncbi:MAG: hypothetical protein PHW10_06280 [Candidatus Peribacteraceae bacterium]|nr:hypothetical protein [Candidatus Peribacteraceae bacterium]
MSDLGPESFSPSEGVAGAPEQLSEDAKQRFAAAAAAMKAIQHEEKRSKKRDTRVARTIVQFLNDDRYAHLFVLISRLVARDCPSVFILAILSLISDDCRGVVQEYLREMGQKSDRETIDESMRLMKTGDLDAETNRALVEWITRMQMVLSLETVPILTRLMVDEHNLDGTVLQLTTFVLQAFFCLPEGGAKEVPFEKLHSLSASILQSVFEPFMDSVDRKFLQKKTPDADGDDEHA